jgi:hypothetical protein
MDLEKAISSAGELLFGFAASLILIPRTLGKILVKPTWIPDYLSSGSDDDTAKKKFEKYSQPILFWIVVGILPYYFLINTYFVGYTEGNVLKAYYEIGATTIISCLSIFLISFPISCAFILQLFKHRGFTATSFRRSLYIQFYLTAPVLLFYITGFFLDYIENEWLLLLFSITFFGSILWFLTAELRVVKKELGLNYFLCFLILTLMYLIFFVFAAICCLLFFLVGMSSFQKLVDAYLAFGSTGSRPNGFLLTILNTNASKNLGGFT